MGLFDWLRGAKSEQALPADEAPAALDCAGLEEALVAAITAQVADFAQAHPDEVFYGFALDCNAYYADVLMSLNTPESLDAATRKFAQSVDPNDVANQKKITEWAVGDWKYLGFNLDSPAWKAQVPMLDDFAELPNSDDTEEFLVICCRALLRAERNGAFLCLKRTSDFRVACIDHDEDVVAGNARLERARIAL